MAADPTVNGWTLILGDDLAAELESHLFRDQDEHGAVLLAGVARGGGRMRLIGRTLVKAEDGVDYVAGVHGYRRLTPAFVRKAILRARGEDLAYLAVHNHGGSTNVAFSDDDRASHARGYPALLDIARGGPVGALVMTREAVAGELWLADGQIAPLTETRVIGERLRRLYPHTSRASAPVEDVYDRQTRIFGAAGQALLRGARIGVLGVGGAGMLLIEYLARLGVGAIVAVAADRVTVTNLPRLPGTDIRDVYPLGRIGRLLRVPGRRKIEVARRLARQANAGLELLALALDVADPGAAEALAGCDFLFCAADSARARLIFNALVQQYGIPGIQVGAKVTADAASGSIEDIRSVVRPVSLRHGCLWCNGLISPSRLAEETLSEAELTAQRYVDDPSVEAPAVITLNAVAASLAANDFLLFFTGVGAWREGYVTIDHRRGRFLTEEPRRDETCPECGIGSASRLGRGDRASLPTMARSAGIGFRPIARVRAEA